MTRRAKLWMNRIGTYWFLLGLLVVVGAGMLGHRWLAPLANLTWLMNGLAFSVMAMMAAPIPLELVRKTVGRPWPALLASLINLGIVPLMGWTASAWLSPDLAGGLIVATSVPSTLTSAAVLARKAGGDDSVSIFTTLITNVACVLVTPLWITWLLGVHVQLSMAHMVINLSLIVLLPILLVQVARWRSAKFCQWSDRAKSRLSVYCQIGILSMVLIGSIQMGQRWQRQTAEAMTGQVNAVEPWQVAVVITLGLVIHLLALYLAWIVGRWTGIRREQAVAVSFSASQKTLMIGLNLAIQCGVNILPMVTYHVFQLLADALIAEKWGRSPKKP